MQGGTSVAVANYGSVLRPGSPGLGQPRHVIEACVTVIDLRSGALMARHRSTDPEQELRHMALDDNGTILAIRARLGPEGADNALQVAIGANGRDETADPGETYLPAAPLLFSKGRAMGKTLAQGQRASHLRHGLSVEYDATHDEYQPALISTHAPI